MPIAQPWVGHPGEREFRRTMVEDLRQERPHSLWSNYLTPQGSTGKNVQSSVLPQHHQMFGIKSEKVG